MDISAASAAVLDTLRRACSQDATVLKPAVAQLQSWENQPGFYSILAVKIITFILETTEHVPKPFEKSKQKKHGT